MYTPAAQAWLGDATDLDRAGCGAESDPKKNLGCPEIQGEFMPLNFWIQNQNATHPQV